MRTKVTNHFSSIWAITEIYWFKSVNFFPFSTCKTLITCSTALKLGLHKTFISTNILSKFQLCTWSAFWVISKLINFQAKYHYFFMFFVSQLGITWPRIATIGTHDAFINSYDESKFQLSRFYRFLVMSKSIFICQNSRTKAKVLRARAKSQ